jgi:hypothetical protein
MQYHMIINMVLGGKKFLSPIQNPKKIFDHCTGTGECSGLLHFIYLLLTISFEIGIWAINICKI